MNFQQLRSVREAARRDFNLTLVAEALHTSQPGVSRQIKELEEELGVDLFVRAGRRFLGLTPVGEQALPFIERMLQDAENLRRIAEDVYQSEVGALTIAATHTQARYALPTAVRDFRNEHPRVSLHLQQGSPRQVAEMVLSGQADLGIATEALGDYPGLLALPCYRWSHVVVVPREHPLAQGTPLTLERLATFPLITYEPGYTGRHHIDEAFRAAGLAPDVVLSAMDADVIKTYVELGIGVGIVASVAFDPARDQHLVALDARPLFALNTTRVAVKRAAFLRGYIYAFIQGFAPTLTREVIDQALQLAPGKELASL